MNFVIGALVAASYVIFGKLSSLFGQVSSIVTIGIFLPEGIALAAALLFGKRVVWGIFLGQLLFAFSNNLGLLPSFLIALINSIEALLAMYIVELWRIDLHLRSVRSVLRFFAMIAFIVQPLSAIAGNAVLAMFGAIQGNFWFFVLSWYLGNILAQFLITPLLLQLAFALQKKALRIKMLLGIVALFGLIGFVVTDLLGITNVVLLFSLSLVVLLIVDYYLGRLCAIVGLTTLSLLLTALGHYGVDMFGISSPMEALININFFILAQVVILYVIDAMHCEKEQLLKQLQEYNSTLQQRVQEEIAKNREKEKLLLQQSRLAQIGETINMIAHQWRQPLNTIAIMIQTLMLKFRSNRLSLEEFSQTTQKIMEQIDGLSVTIDQFSNFFKTEEKRRVVAVEDVVEKVVALIKPQVEKVGITLQVQSDGNYYIDGYPNALGQALMHIIANAKEQLQSCIACKRKKITITITADSKSVQIAIADTGGGIEEAMMDTIFEPYVSTKGKNGLGLGLYITKMIIEEHMDGKIRVYNEEDGAVFVIWLQRYIQ